MQFSTALLAAITVGVQVLAAPSFVSKRTAVVESVAEDLYNTISTLEVCASPVFLGSEENGFEFQ